LRSLAAEQGPESRSIAASVFASGIGPRRTARAMLVINFMSPESAIAEASAVGPSSHGVEKRKWSLAATVVKPASRAALTALVSRCREIPSSPNSISGRCRPNSIFSS
jgi:hypothetical protein